MTTTPTVEELIAHCDKEIASCKSVANAALEAFGHDNNRKIQEKKAAPYLAIRTRLLAAQEMAEALISVSPQKDGLSFNVANKVINALAAWDGK